jgi:hypothetical protein
MGFDPKLKAELKRAQHQFERVIRSPMSRLTRPIANSYVDWVGWTAG